ncbi:MAG: thioredoxin domain-containing protein [Terriglobales bacterium]
MRRIFVPAFAVLVLLTGVVFAQQTRRPPDPAASNAALQARVRAFLHRTLGWQNLDKLEVESISPPDPSGLRTVTVLLAKGTQQKTAKYLITADEREIIEGGEADRLSPDPWAQNRTKLQLRHAPATGSPTAPVTIVEFSDLECPYCKEEAGNLEQLMNVDPGKARLVFKYFPLTEIHPWSMQAAEAAVCVAQQGSPKFWDFEKAVFAAQDQITTADASSRLRTFASESGAALPPYDACLARPSTRADVESSIANGKQLGVSSTPTLFVDGRPIPGAIPEQELQMLVDFEANFHVNQTSAAAVPLGGALQGTQCGKCKPLPPLSKSKPCCGRG